MYKVRWPELPATGPAASTDRTPATSPITALNFRDRQPIEHRDHSHGRRPVISVDTKKKELIGNYENKGRQWRRSKSPALVQSHDFPAPSVPRAYPYGVYDLARNKGFVNVGTDHDTGAFAVASIRGWWRFEGKRLYPRARRLLITADGGGSNRRALG